MAIGLLVPAFGASAHAAPSAQATRQAAPSEEPVSIEACGYWNVQTPTHAWNTARSYWSLCFNGSVPVDLHLQRKRWYGWENVANKSFTPVVGTIYTGWLTYTCGGQGTYTYRAYGHYRNVNGVNFYTYSGENRFTC
ncbi:MAG TPA: hypothetical protein VFB84_13385 [Micromonosporaceae bacterium]|nr:hypothetical protein [Micromonosporaceae bacterium]